MTGWEPFRRFAISRHAWFRAAILVCCASSYGYGEPTLEHVRGFFVTTHYSGDLPAPAATYEEAEAELKTFATSRANELGLKVFDGPPTDLSVVELRVIVESFQFGPSDYLIRIEMTVFQMGVLIKRPEVVLSLPTWSTTTRTNLVEKSLQRELLDILGRQLEKLQALLVDSTSPAK